MTVWEIWVIVAIVLFIAEVLTTGFILACFGIGALGAAVAAVVGGSLTVQLISFSVVTLIVFFSLRPLFIRHFYRTTQDVRTNVDALLGRKGIVSVPIDPNTHQGRVIVHGDDWWAFSSTGVPIAAGEKVVVVGVEGTKIFVKRAISSPEEVQA